MGSHDGIRIGDARELTPPRRAARPLGREATAPAKVKVDKSGGTGMNIDWQDGHASHWNFAWLRNACPCATCVDEREQFGLEPGQAKPEQSKPNALPMYKEPPRPRDVQRVGHYALRFAWNDGHESGIYSWDYLRRVCQCEECLRENAAEQQG